MLDSRVRLDELVGRLRDSGYRLTPQRMAVLRILAGSGHPTVQEIYEQVRIDFPMVSLATIYSTVTLLKEMGEIHELGFSDGSNRYDGSTPHVHPHLICIRCNHVIDLEGDVLCDFPQEVAQSTGYKIVNHRLDLFGICPKCQEEEATIVSQYRM